MKKSAKIYTLLALIVFAGNGVLFAQDSHVAILLNTVNSNLNYGSMNSSLKGYKKDIRGIQAGLSWQAGVTKHFSIVTEAYFVKKGGILKAGNPLNDLKSTLKLYTMEVPILARFHTGRFYFNAGPYVNYIFSGRTKTGEEGTHSITFNHGPGGFTKWEGGMQGGAGYQFALKKTKLALDVRYVYGMTNISRLDDLYNRTLNISLLVRRGRKHSS